MITYKVKYNFKINNRHRMNIKYLILPLTLVTLSFAACSNEFNPDSEADLSSKLDSLSYSLGYITGQNFADQGVDDINYNDYLAGFSTALNEKESKLNEFEMQVALQVFQQELQEKQAAEREEASKMNIESGEKFLQENAQREDVNVTDSGLQYRVIEEGTGERPDAEDEVEVHYKGTLTDGREFDSSYGRGETATFPLNRVIKGWTEGLQLMREGATYEFFIPAELAYGSNPPGGSIIEPGSVLVFEVELIDIKDGE